MGVQFGGLRSAVWWRSQCTIPQSVQLSTVTFIIFIFFKWVCHMQRGEWIYARRSRVAGTNYRGALFMHDKKFFIVPPHIPCHSAAQEPPHQAGKHQQICMAEGSQTLYRQCVMWCGTFFFRLKIPSSLPGLKQPQVRGYKTSLRQNCWKKYIHRTVATVSEKHATTMSNFCLPGVIERIYLVSGFPVIRAAWSCPTTSCGDDRGAQLKN